jgi:hypothetical protein
MFLIHSNKYRSHYDVSDYLPKQAKKTSAGKHGAAVLHAASETRRSLHLQGLGPFASQCGAGELPGRPVKKQRREVGEDVMEIGGTGLLIHAAKAEHAEGAGQSSAAQEEATGFGDAAEQQKKGKAKVNEDSLLSPIPNLAFRTVVYGANDHSLKKLRKSLPPVLWNGDITPGLDMCAIGDPGEQKKIPAMQLWSLTMYKQSAIW